MFEIKLGLQAFLRNRKRTFTTLGIITLLITFVVLINAIIYTNRATSDLHLEHMYGSWSHAFTDENKAEAFEPVGSYSKITDSLGSFDENMFKLSNFEYYKGRQPRNEDEVIVTLNAINTLGISYDLNQILTIDGYEFELVGIIYPYDADWVWIEGIEYPTIITTNITSSDIVYFGRAIKLTPAYNINDYVVVNTRAYPYIEQQSEAPDRRYEETMILNEQSLKLTQFVLVVIGMVLVLVFKNNAEFYQKRFVVFSQQGMTKWGLLKYILPQLIIYALLVPIGFYGIHLLFKYGSVPIRQIRYDNNLKNLQYAGIRVCMMVALFQCFSFVLERFKFQQTFRLRIVQVLLVMLVGFSTVYIATPQTITLHEERIPEWKLYNQIWESSMYYIANGSMAGGFEEEENRFSHFKTEWRVEDFEDLLSHPKTKYVYYWNIRYVQYTGGDYTVENTTKVAVAMPGFELGQSLGLKYYKDEFLKTDVFTNDFLKGNSFYLHKDHGFKMEAGDILYLNDVPFYYEKNYDPDDIHISGIPLISSGFLISETGAKRLGLPTDEYNIFRVGVEKISDFLEYDALVRRVAKRSIFDNFRLNVERGIRREKGITIFMALEVLIQYSLGIAILALLFLQSLMAKRKPMAIYHFLGESKTKMVIKNTVSYVLPALIVILPAVLRAGEMATQSSSLVFSSIIGIIFVFVLLIVCLLIHIYYFKENLFELLDERE